MDHNLKNPVFSIELEDMTSVNVLNMVNQSQRAMNKLLKVCLKHNGLTVTQWMILGSLASGPRTSVELIKSLGVTAPYISITIRQLRLEMSDYITESGIEEDIRLKVLGLSESGKQFVADVESKLQVCLRRELVQRVAPADLETYFNVTGFIAQNVKHLD